MPSGRTGLREGRTGWEGLGGKKKTAGIVRRVQRWTQRFQIDDA